MRVDHVNHEGRSDAREARDQAADDLGVCAVADHDPDAPLLDQRAQADERPADAERVTEPRPRQLDDLGAELAQALGQVSVPEAQAGDQAASAKLRAALQQVQQHALPASDLGRRLNEQEVSSLFGTGGRQGSSP